MRIRARIHEYINKPFGYAQGERGEIFEIHVRDFKAKVYRKDLKQGVLFDFYAVDPKRVEVKHKRAKGIVIVSVEESNGKRRNRNPQITTRHTFSGSSVQVVSETTNRIEGHRKPRWKKPKNKKFASVISPNQS